MIETQHESTSTNQDELAARIVEAYNRGDMAGAAAPYAEDAVWCGSATGMVNGRAGIQGAYEQLAKMGVTRMTVELLESKVEGNSGYAVAHFRLFAASGQTVMSGHSLALTERQGNGWQIHHYWAVSEPSPR